MRQQAWAWVLALGLVACVGYFFIGGTTGKDVAYSTIGVASTVCLILAVRHKPPATRLGWALLAAANLCFVLGDGVYDGYDLVLHRSAPTPSVADVSYLLGYLFLFAGILRMTRSRGLSASWERHADSAIVSIGALALSWQFLMSSYAHDKSLTYTARAVAIAYPLMDLVVLFIAASALLSGVTRRPAEKFLVGALVALLLGDVTNNAMTLHTAYQVGNPSDGLLLLNYVLMAAAALHPTSREPLVEPSDSGLQIRRWLPLVAVAGSISPVLLLLSQVGHFWVDVPVLASTSLALFALVVLRVSWLFTRIRGQNNLLELRTASLQEALINQRNLETDLRHQAFHDNLTGLANRALLHERVGHALAEIPRSGAVALCFCDLDGFKAVNDSLGHHVGDQLLTIAAKRLASVTRGTDTVARLGGDEFAVLLDHADPMVATPLAERIVSVLRQPATVDGAQITLSVSVGVAFAQPQTTTEELISQADTAMYEAKSAGKDRFAVFETSMHSRLVDLLTVTNGFPGSLAREEFLVEYEPQVSLADGRLQGFEALVRWQHPTLGPLAPLRFIALAEESGFIEPLGRWVLEAACVEAASWATAFGPPLTVSVNISGRQLQNPGLVQDVWNALSLSKLHPRRLILEITESVLMTNPIQATQSLTQLKKMGVRVAIDDFGTGYSSLSYLRQFPVDILKIDKSFIDPLADPGSEGTAFVETIVRLATDLGLATIAEGVEHAVQRDILRELGCLSVQGYLLSRPMSPDATRAFIASSTREFTATSAQRLTSSRLGSVGRTVRASAD